MSNQTSMKDMSSTRHTAQISARWYWQGAFRREVLEVGMPMPLAQMINIHQVQTTGIMRGALMDETTGCIELRDVGEGKAAARDRVLGAARMLRFLAHTGMRPATEVEIDRAYTALDGTPGHNRVIAAAWAHVDSGAWVAAITSAEPSSGARATWCRRNGIAYLPPDWVNAWGPRAVALPHLMCSDEATAAVLAAAIGRIDAAGPLVWSGRSVAGSVTTPKGRTLMRADAPSPAQILPMEQHLALASTLNALIASSPTSMITWALQDIRAELGRWFAAEHPDHAEVYSAAAGPIHDRAAQLQAIGQAVEILIRGYDRSAPRDAMVTALRKVRARLVASMAPAQTAASPTITTETEPAMRRLFHGRNSSLATVAGGPMW
ncbi:hypothetical protein DyAD56_16295 [Dyella sp. AD56]|uniref:hypothetical protein n=1 Tax=Dyella sp. AD56 TaxID=1528744 RepID=UPI000C84280A|nr:hypothetical protein [Dyella sp. AD56]PMQ04249.1 hypothetical protein DyAD56_16295 [Dyella sp. AD56]